MTLNEVNVFLRFAVGGDDAAAALRYGDLFLTSEMLCCFSCCNFIPLTGGIYLHIYIYKTEHLRVKYILKVFCVHCNYNCS